MDAMEPAFTDPSIDRIPEETRPFDLFARYDTVLTPRDLRQSSFPRTHKGLSRGGVRIYPT
jgi:hypothetical protein